MKSTSLPCAAGCAPKELELPDNKSFIELSSGAFFAVGNWSLYADSEIKSMCEFAIVRTKIGKRHSVVIMDDNPVMICNR